MTTGKETTKRAGAEVPAVTDTQVAEWARRLRAHQQQHIANWLVEIFHAAASREIETLRGIAQSTGGTLQDIARCALAHTERGDTEAATELAQQALRAMLAHAETGYENLAKIIATLGDRTEANLVTELDQQAFIKVVTSLLQGDHLTESSKAQLRTVLAEMYCDAHLDPVEPELFRLGLPHNFAKQAAKL